MTADLAKALMTKPVPIEQSFFRLQFFYIDNTSFELKLNGYFQLLGQFMKCEVKWDVQGPTLRVASQRQGDAKTLYTRIQNLDRVRVVVE